MESDLEFVLFSLLNQGKSIEITPQSVNRYVVTLSANGRYQSGYAIAPTGLADALMFLDKLLQEV